MYTDSFSNKVARKEIYRKRIAKLPQTDSVNSGSSFIKSQYKELNKFLDLILVFWLILVFF